MKPLRFRQRLTCLLLSFCVALASVGTTRAEMACAMERAVRSTSPTTAPPTSCCAKAAQAAPLVTAKAKKGCCALKVTHHHVAPEAAGAFFKLPAPFVLTLPPTPFVWPVNRHWALAAAPVLRLFAANSSPPGRLVGWALVRALHQLRN